MGKSKKNRGTGTKKYSAPMYSFNRRTLAAGLFVLIVFYFLIASFVVMKSLDAIDIDGVSYILLAQHYLNSEWNLAVSGYWSPLITWLLIPLIAIGLDPLHAFRYLLVLSGAGFVLAAWKLSDRFSIAPHFRLAATGCAAAMAAIFTGGLLTPDLLLVTILAVYFYLTLHPDFGNNARIGFYCGITAGFAYLAKSYAGPFFLLHFMVLTGWLALKKEGAARRYLLKNLGLGLLGFILIAGPWITTISVKYNHPTLSTATVPNRAIIAPGVERGKHPMGSGLWTVPPGRLNLWEDPTLLPYKDWSPFESMENFKHQLDEMSRSAEAVSRLVMQFDFFKLSLMGLLSSIWLAVSKFTQKGEKQLYQWSLLTIASYCSGYLLFGFASEFRYYWPISMILLILVFHLLDRLTRVLNIKMGEPSFKFIKRSLLVLIFIVSIASFLIYPFMTFTFWSSGPSRGHVYRQLSEDLRKYDIHGPFASNEWYGGFFLSYYLKETYSGRPLSFGLDLEEKIRTARVKTLFVWGPAQQVTSGFVGRQSFQFVTQYLASAGAEMPTDLTVYRINEAANK